MNDSYNYYKLYSIIVKFKYDRNIVQMILL